eukprot:9189217-Pyramimonas_sp.AAC.1
MVTSAPKTCLRSSEAAVATDERKRQVTARRGRRSARDERTNGRSAIWSGPRAVCSKARGFAFGFGKHGGAIVGPKVIGLGLWVG